MTPLVFLQDVLVSEQGPERAVEAFRRAGCRPVVVSAEGRGAGAADALAADIVGACGGLGGDAGFALVSIAVARRLLRRTGGPRLWFDAQDYAMSRTAATLGAHLLNGDRQWFLPWAEVRRRHEQIVALFGRHVFLRPDDGNKTFAGQVVDLGDWPHAANGLEAGSPIAPQTMVVVAPAVTLEGPEWRLWVRRDEGPIAWAAHGPDGWMPDAPEPPAEARRLAREVAMGLGAPDEVFVIDVRRHEGRLRVVELNAASTSGVYGADLDRLAEGLVAAWRLETAAPGA
jgi:hypothetical protein